MHTHTNHEDPPISTLTGLCGSEVRRTPKSAAILNRSDDASQMIQDVAAQLKSCVGHELLEKLRVNVCKPTCRRVGH